MRGFRSILAFVALSSFVAIAPIGSSNVSDDLDETGTLDSAGFAVNDEDDEESGTNQRGSLHGIAMDGWEITEITGSIVDERVGGGLENFCDYYRETYHALLASQETFIRLLEREKPPDLEGIPPELFEVRNIPGEKEGVFIFSFAFDNGYHSNRVLEGLGVQLAYSQFIPGLWDFAIGFWSEAGVDSEIQVGSAGGGKSTFSVTGRFEGQNRLVGKWVFEAVTALPGGVVPECNTAAFGEGTWVAELR